MLNSVLCPLSGAEFRRRRQQLLWDGQGAEGRRNLCHFQRWELSLWAAEPQRICDRCPSARPACVPLGHPGEKAAERPEVNQTRAERSGGLPETDRLA